MKNLYINRKIINTYNSTFQINSTLFLQGDFMKTILISLMFFIFLFRVNVQFKPKRVIFSACKSEIMPQNMKTESSHNIFLELKKVSRIPAKQNFYFCLKLPTFGYFINIQCISYKQITCFNAFNNLSWSTYCHQMALIVSTINGTGSINFQKFYTLFSP